jgi:hypothetical protein
MRKSGLLTYVLLGVLAVGAVVMVAYLIGTPGWNAEIVAPSGGLIPKK